MPRPLARSVSGWRERESGGSARMGLGSSRTRDQGMETKGSVATGRAVPSRAGGWRPDDDATAGCHEQRMLRALHGRWPYRRSHCRHDLHWLVRVHPPQGCWCSSGRGTLPGRVCGLTAGDPRGVQERRSGTYPCRPGTEGRACRGGCSMRACVGARARARRSRRSAAARPRAAGRGPCPRSSSAAARGIARAVARPPEGATSRSAVPWITSVGAVMRCSSVVRSPEAMIAASWRPGPAGSWSRS